MRGRRLVIGLLVVASAAGCLRETEEAERSSDRPSTIVLLSIDTLRSDRLPAYGYEGIATPRIDELTSDSILFENVWANAPLTLPSHLSMLTGLYPDAHGVRNNIGFTLDSNVRSIVEDLSEAGYETGGFVSSWVLRSGSGIERGFDHFDDEMARSQSVSSGEIQRSGAETIRNAIAWLEDRDESDVFLFVHLYEPHTPWAAPEPYRSRYSVPYDAEIAYTDALVGELIDELDRLGRFQESLLLLTSDHGEGLGDHGETEHGVFLYREALQVPLIVRLPGGKDGGRKEERLTSLTDLAAMLSRRAGLMIEFPDAVDPLAETGRKLLVAETFYPRIHLGWSELFSVVDERSHLIEAPAVELYDYVVDPGELRNRADEERRIVTEMRKALDEYGTEAPSPGDITREDAEKLASLGYLGSVSDRGGPLPDPKDRIADLELLRESAMLESRGRIEEALALVSEMNDVRTGFTEGLIREAELWEKAGRPEPAFEAWRRALRSAPELADEIGLSAAATLLEMGRDEEAKAHAELALDRNPGDASLLLARIARRGGELGEALRLGDVAARDLPVEAGLFRVETLVRSGKISEAASALEAMGQRAEGARDAARLRGELLAESGDLERAILQFEKEVSNHPGNLLGWSSLIVAKAMSHPQEVDDVIERMLAANPSPRALEHAAVTLETLGDARGAAGLRARR